MSKKSYSELIKLKTFEERFQYLKLNGVVAEETFGSRRSLNQDFYRSKEWKSVRDKVILRDDGCDLSDPNHRIYGKIIVHHINPITAEDILNRDPILFDMDNLICITKATHDAIHYGSEDILVIEPIERKPNDTIPWKE